MLRISIFIKEIVLRRFFLKIPVKSIYQTFQYTSLDFMVYLYYLILFLVKSFFILKVQSRTVCFKKVFQMIYFYLNFIK